MAHDRSAPARRAAHAASPARITTASTTASTTAPDRERRGRVGRALLVGAILVLNLCGIALVREATLAEVRRELADARSEAPARRLVRVQEVRPLEPDADTVRVSVLLDGPIAPAGAVGTRAEAPPFVLEPAPDGHWTYASPERLDFEPVRPLPGGGSWTLRADDDALERLGVVLEGPRSFTLQASTLDVEACAVLARERDGLRLELRFDDRVAPAALEARLRVEDGLDGSPLPVRVLGNEPARRLGVSIPVADDPARGHVLVRIAEGLAAVGAERGMPRPFARQATLPDRFQALRIRGEHRRGGEAAIVRIDCSRRLDPDQARPDVVVQPPVEDLEVRTTERTVELRGRFEPRRRYRIVVPATVVSDGGETLGTTRTLDLDMPPLPPTLELRTGDGILARSGGRTIEIEAVNTGPISVTVSRVEPRNLHAHLGRARVRVTDRELVRATIDLPGHDDVRRRRAIDLASAVGDAPGLYRIRLRGERTYWRGGRALLAITDLGLTVRRERDGAFVHVRSIDTSRPLVGVRVAAIAANGAVLAEAFTAADGAARLRIDRAHPDGDPVAWTAARGDDVAFIPAGRTLAHAANVDRTGRAHPGPLDCFLATDRGAVRPGEDVEVLGVLRDDAGRPVPDLPVELRLVRPDGLVEGARTVEACLERDGTLTASFAVHERAPRGRWAVEARLAGDDARTLGRADFVVESFLPVRTEVSVIAPELVVSSRPGPRPRVRWNVGAVRLAGGPESDATVAARVREVPVRHASARHPDLRFDLAPGRAHRHRLGDVRTDADGRAVLERDRFEARGRRRLDAVVDVTPSAGRTVSARSVTIIDDAPGHLGLGGPDDLPRPGETFPLRWAHVDAADAPLPVASLEIEVVRVFHEWNLVERRDGTYRWIREERLGTPQRRTIAGGALGGDGTSDAAAGDIPVALEHAGRWRLTARAPDTDAAASIEIVCAAHGATGTAGSPIDVAVLPRTERVLPGTSLPVVARSPFAGTLLLALETDRVLAWTLAEVEAGDTELALEVPASITGGAAWITASLVRPLARAVESPIPHRASGIARVEVDRSARRLEVDLALPTTTRPGTTIDVRVRAVPSAGGDATTERGDERDGDATGARKGVDPAPAGHAVVWAVDDGLLLPTGYRLPDPFTHFLGPRRHAVSTDDAWRRLLPDRALPTGPVLRIGASEERDGGAPARSVPIDLGPPVVVAPIIVPLAADGTATVPLDVPDGPGSQTRLRVMAVVAGRDAFGAAESAIEVARPVSVTLLAPLAVAPGDEALLALRVDNRTDAVLALRPVALSEGPVLAAAPPVGHRDGDARRRPLLPMTLPPGGTRTVSVPLATTDGIGVGRVRIVLEPADDSSGAVLAALDAAPAAEASITVRPPSELVTRTTIAAAVAGAPVTADWPADLRREGGRLEVVVGPRRELDLAPAIDAGIGYPHGCAEQTASRLMVALAAHRLGLAESRGIDVPALVAAGGRRLAALRHGSGSIGWWSPRGPAGAWLDAWCALALQESVDVLGTPVPGWDVDAIAALLGRLDRVRLGADPPPSTRALVLRALAVHGRPHAGDMLQLAARAESLDAAGLAHLAAGLVRAGRRGDARALLERFAVPPSIDPANVGRHPWSSRPAGRALLLESLLLVDPGHPWRDALVSEIEALRTAPRARSTIELAAMLRALARVDATEVAAGAAGADDAPAAPLAGRIVVGGDVVALDPAAPVRAVGTSDAPPTVHVDAGRAVTAVLARGLPVAPPAALDRGLVVRRTFLTPEGDPLPDLDLERGELVVVRVTLVLPADDAGRPVRHVAIVDLLPGGLEIEHPGLRTSASASAAATPSPATRSRRRAPAARTVVFDADRVVVVTDATSSPRTFEWTLRAATPGRYTVPPVRAEAMYEPARASVHRGGIAPGEPIVVRPRAGMPDAVATAGSTGTGRPDAPAVAPETAP